MNELVGNVTFKRVSASKYLMIADDNNLVSDIVRDRLEDILSLESSEFSYTVNKLLETSISSRLVVDAFIVEHRDVVDAAEFITISYSDSSGSKNVNVSNSAKSSLGGYIYGIQKI